MRQYFVLSHDVARSNAIQAVQNAPEGKIVEIRDPTRTLEQNSLLWPLLTDVSKQVEWHGQYLKQDEWKDMFTAALKKQKVAPGIDGGFVVIGASTSKMTKQEFTNLIEFIYAFGAEHNVKWTDEKDYR